MSLGRSHGTATARQVAAGQRRHKRRPAVLAQDEPHGEAEIGGEASRVRDEPTAYRGCAVGIVLAMVDHRRLGRSGLSVSELSLGGAGIGGLYGPVRRDQGVSTIRRAVELGIDYVEMAPFYGDSEQTLRAALDELGDEATDLHLCTKVGMHPARHGDYSASAALWSVEQSLRVLGLDSIDLVQVHAIDAIDIDLVLGPQGAVTALERLREDGRIRAIGFAIRGAGYHRAAIESGRFDVLMVHDDFSLIRRSDETVIADAAAAGMGVLVARVLMTGLLAGNDPMLDERLSQHADAAAAHDWWRWAKEREVPLSAVALQFALRQPHVSSVVVGASSPAEVEASVAAIGHSLPDGIWNDVDDRLRWSEDASA